MSQVKPRPAKLYKYRQFSEVLVDQLCHDDIYFADPVSFNDPLDCLPVVADDFDISAMRSLLGELILRRAGKEIDEALKKLKFKGAKAEARRAALTQSEVEAVIQDIEYHATNPDIEDRDWYLRNTFKRAVEKELRAAYGRGVLSLSEHWDSPLMWSHYAHQHCGVCIEYDVSDLPEADFHRVIYDGSREVRCEWIQRWLMNEETDAQRELDRACLLAKAGQWRYEDEWRMLGNIGLTQSRLVFASVTFGMRCPRSVRYALVAALGGENARVGFFDIDQPSSTFELTRSPVEVGELMSGMPRMSAYHAFRSNAI